MSAMSLDRLEAVPFEWLLRWGNVDLVEWADSMVGRKMRGTVRVGGEIIHCNHARGVIEVR
jgi:hypothetical protein